MISLLYVLMGERLYKHPLLNKQGVRGWQQCIMYNWCLHDDLLCVMIVNVTVSIRTT